MKVQRILMFGCLLLTVLYQLAGLVMYNTPTKELQCEAMQIKGAIFVAAGMVIIAVMVKDER